MEAWKIVLGLFALILVVAAGAWAVSQLTFGSCIASLSLHGEISNDGPSFFSAGPSARTWIEKIKQFNDSSAPALLLDINSPGGGAVASKELYDTLRAVNKPVVAYLGEVAASGGYYAASATKYIVANPNTLTGSIGARAEIVNYEELFQKIGLRQDSVQNGRLKDIGAGYRNMTPEERQILQGIIDELKGNFENDVKTARTGKLTPAFNAVLDSRVLSAKQALAAGLIDKIGSRQDALDQAAELADLDKNPTECPLDTSNPLDEAFQSFGSGFAHGLLVAFPSSTRLVFR